MNNTFVVGVPGTSAWEAFQLAVSLSSTNPKDYGKMTDKYSFMYWDVDAYASYDDAATMALQILEHGDSNPDIKVMPPLCVRYKNVNEVVEFLFFGWNYDE